jgi:hypothetical protein
MKIYEFTSCFSLINILSIDFNYLKFLGLTLKALIFLQYLYY